MSKDENEKESLEELERKFKKYSEMVKKFKNVSDENKLFLYAHYKQVTCGNNTNPKPFILNRVEMEKWKTWFELNNLSKEDAINKYVKKVKDLYKIQ